LKLNTFFDSDSSKKDSKKDSKKASDSNKKAHADDFGWVDFCWGGYRLGLQQWIILEINVL